MSNSNTVEMGWGARPMKEQHPVLSDRNAEHFDQDNAAISRLKIRGIITPSEAERARQRYVENVSEAIHEAHVASEVSA